MVVHQKQNCILEIKKKRILSTDVLNVTRIKSWSHPREPSKIIDRVQMDNTEKNARKICLYFIYSLNIATVKLKTIVILGC